MRPTPLTEHDLQTYRRRLRETTAGVGGEVDELEVETLRPTGTEAGGAAASQPDPAALSAAEGLAAVLLAAEGYTLAEVNAALGRLGRGRSAGGRGAAGRSPRPG